MAEFLHLKFHKLRYNLRNRDLAVFNTSEIK